MNIRFLLFTAILCTVFTANSNAKTLTGAQIKRTLVGSTLSGHTPKYGKVTIYFGSGRMCWRDRKNHVLTRRWYVKGDIYYSGRECSGGCAVSKNGNKVSFRKISGRRNQIFSIRRGNRVGCK